MWLATSVGIRSPSPAHCQITVSKKDSNFIVVLECSFLLWLHQANAWCALSYPKRQPCVGIVSDFIFLASVYEGGVHPPSSDLSVNVVVNILSWLRGAGRTEKLTDFCSGVNLNPQALGALLATRLSCIPIINLKSEQLMKLINYKSSRFGQLTSQFDRLHVLFIAMYCSHC